MRAYHAAALGCLPVLIQQDEKQTHPQACASPRLAAYIAALPTAHRPPRRCRKPSRTIARLGRLRRAAAILPIKISRPSCALAANATALKASGALAAVIPFALAGRDAGPRRRRSQTRRTRSRVMATLAMRGAHGLRASSRV